VPNIFYIPDICRGLVQEYQLFEFFAGNANLSKCARASGLTTASFDILFDAQKPGRSYGSNSMDILSDSGFASFVHSNDAKDLCIVIMWF